MPDLESLNEPQREAVLATEGPLLVLAGAGSGKTRVLTYRIAHLVEDLDVPPWNILAVTFTNKAAREMRDRLERLVSGGIRGMWIYTFHSMCVRMLRANADVLGYTSSFTIYDADDSKRLVKEVMSQLNYDTKFFPDAMVRNRISAAKNELIGPDEYSESAREPQEKCVAAVYHAMQERLKRANAMDFDDLLYNAYVLLRDNEEIRTSYATSFRYIMVDEYQDTNKAQYVITKLLASVHRNLMVVGDDDQSIYSWRGADIRNILDFERDWPDAKTVKLEQNYRSTATILDAANAVISMNESRKPKKLFTDGAKGEKISLYLAADERDEGRWIAAEIDKLHEQRTDYHDIAVFYRTNAQSRMLEDMFLRAGVPYQIVGGTRFFDREEIRDCMAYLKLAVNPADDMSAQRVINKPRRGIGKTTVDRITHTANTLGISFFEAARAEADDPETRSSVVKALNSFIDLIDEARDFEGNLEDIVRLIVDRSGLVDALQAQRTEEAASRIENIQEFFGVVADYVETHADDAEAPTDEDDADAPAEVDPLSLAGFLEWLSLRTDLDALGEADDAVTMMTIHSAKGLEFDDVFCAGMEESIFPHQNSIAEQGIEEERRLAYVAITRARKRLYLTHAQTRHLFGSMQSNVRSRFVSEIPSELIDHVGVGSRGLSGTGWEKRGDRHGTFGSGQGEEMYGGRVFGKGASKAETTAAKGKGNVFAVGDTVDHKVFGRGCVEKIEGDKLFVTFEKTGQTKQLLKNFAPMVKIG